MFCPECGVENNLNAKFCEQCGNEFGPQSVLPTKGKPLGIVVIVILSVVSGMVEMGLGSVITIIPEFMGLAITSRLMGAGFESGVDASVHIASLKIAGIGVALFASGVLTLAASYGLWSFIGWGRVLAIVLYSVGLLVGLILFFTSLDVAQTAGSIALQLIGFGVTIWIQIYLFRPHIRNLFHGPGSLVRNTDTELKVQVANRLG